MRKYHKKRVKGGILLSVLCLFSLFFVLLAFQVKNVSQTIEFVRAMEEGEKINCMVEVAREKFRNGNSSKQLFFDVGEVSASRWKNKKGVAMRKFVVTLNENGAKTEIAEYDD
ncbi:hypothetical protein SAMN02745116_02592 [Pilibacter termitis]|uniref:Uncharacterized protein n=1 Tax=Pilibacter termitis TaxID=263852 RepID=A0A1T4RGL7_9ENTE|nr:competence type IV pilus minor pilin ComGG [Pilibacter termitis]SKA15049.1 hypothetical protein SAMN02745116_02592 [Pilibacter termitis]